MALEMGIARLKGELLGKTSKERYHDFIRQKLHTSQALRTFFNEYRELSRFVGTFLLLWVERTVEFFHRLKADLSLLKNHFNHGNPLGPISQLDVGLSDPHLGGRSVFCLRFENGISLFYKPKNLDIVAAYNAFIKKLNQLGLTPALKSYEILARGDYGWEEKIEGAPCKNEEEVSLFYQRAGMLLCVLHLLRGNDAHRENLIASGEHPVLIDLETLFHTSLQRSNSLEEATKKMEHSVLLTGMLPMCFLGERGFQGVDLSALGTNNEEQKWPIKSFGWNNTNTDTMHLVQEWGTIQLDSCKHQVKLGDKIVAASEHVEALVKGFETLHIFLCGHRDLFLEKESPLWQMIKAPVRILLRLTMFYSHLLDRLFDPRVLLDSLHTEELLEMLKNTLRDTLPEHRDSIIEEEKQALMQGDIPCFHALPTHTDLYSRKKLIASDALSEQAAKSVIDHLKKMDAKDCHLQTTFIRQAFQARKMKAHDGGDFFSKKSEGDVNASREPVPNSELLTYAEEIAEDILNRSLRDKDGALGWIGLDPDATATQFLLRPLSNTLYAGNAGIAIFFAALYAVTKKSSWKEESLNVLKQFRKQLHGDSKKWLIAANGIGGMSGAGGILYSLTLVARLTEEPELINEAFVLLGCLEDRHIYEDQQYDVLSGSAGLLLTLLSLHSYTHDTKSLALAKICGEHLCRAAIDMGNGAVAWGKEGTQPLLGFSHGTAGIAYALSKLANYVENNDLLAVAKRALTYERQFLSSELKNWPDFRHNPPNYPIQWCHGCAGIGLSRLASLSFSQDREIMIEVELAIRSTQENLISPLSHLCCGTFGRIEFLLQAARTLSRPILEQQIRQCIDHFFVKDNENKIHFELRTLIEGFYSPGFMVGTAGIGYTLLRLQDQKHELPQVLLLQ